MGKIRFNANALVTDAHIHELSEIEWPLLHVFDVRACAHVTPFAKDYIQTIRDKHTQTIAVVRSPTPAFAFDRRFSPR